MMKVPLIFLSIFCFYINASFAQRPYLSTGIQKQILSLSNGKFQEIHENDSLIKVGSVLVSLNSGSVVFFSCPDTVFYEFSLEPEITSRWWSPDPAEHEFPDISPYNFAADNPIIFIDPDGERIFLSFNNFLARRAYVKVVKREIGDQFKVELEKTKHPITGKKEYELKLVAKDGGGDATKLTGQGEAFYSEMDNMIKDPVDVHINVVYFSNKVDIGMYGRIGKDGAIDIADVQAFNKDHGLTQAGTLVHETIEQLEKVKGGKDPDYQDDHQVGIEAENRVNQTVDRIGEKNLIKRGKAVGKIVAVKDSDGKRRQVKMRNKNIFGGYRRKVKIKGNH